jgi:two-component system, OmpR family, flagellar system response regulator FtcR
LFVIVGESDSIAAEYTRRFEHQGVSLKWFPHEDFRNWLTAVADVDLGAVEAFLLGDSRDRQLYSKMIKERTRAPVIAMNEASSLEQALDLFAAGVDDFVRKPIHVREILARVGAIRRRLEGESDSALVGDLRVFFDGRDPQLKGIPLSLPRRERRILEYLVKNQGRRVSKAQVFNSIYGIFDENVEENVVESHINNLRKKLRRHLGYDPINSVRYLGYRLDEPREKSSDLSDFRKSSYSGFVNRAIKLGDLYSNFAKQSFKPALSSSLSQFELVDGDGIMDRALQSLKKAADDLMETAEARTNTVAQLSAHSDKIDRTQSETRSLLKALVGTG